MFARHIAANFINILILLVLGVVMLVFLAQAQYNQSGPLKQDVEFAVENNDRLASGKRTKGVAERLEDEGIISSSFILRAVARYNKNDNKLKAGDYIIPAGASMAQVLQIINSGVGISQSVTFPEGWTSYQIVQRLNAVEDLNGEITEIPPEGSLAPNTYSYNRSETRQSIIDKMTSAQNAILEAAWNNRAPDLPLKSKEEALILASIVERETGVSSERGEVAAVFINRLNKGMKLQTDPTVIYGITLGKGGLGRGLRRSELLKKTPYNTYVIPALPPGPIANPGKASIEAALNPNETENLFFVADGTGGHSFAKTLKQHNANVAKWRQIERTRKANKAKAEANNGSSEN